MHIHKRLGNHLAAATAQLGQLAALKAMAKMEELPVVTKPSNSNVSWRIGDFTCPLSVCFIIQMEQLYRVLYLLCCVGFNMFNHLLNFCHINVFQGRFCMGNHAV